MKARVLVCLLLVGCSTFEVADEYTLTDKSLRKRIDMTDGAVSVGFEPAMRFSSVGTWGLPVVPSLERPDPGKEIVLVVGLALEQHHEFFLPASVCVADESHVRVCSEQALVNARILWRDSSGHNNLLKLPYDPHRPFYMPITLESGATTIGSEVIYSLYAYNGEPRWDHFSMDLLYRFRCQSACPTEAILKLDGLVTVDGVALTGPDLLFHRVRAKHYRPIVGPQ